MRARHEIGVLALPSEPRARGQRLFHQRGGIDEDLYFAAAFSREPGGEVLQLRFKRVVIIAAGGVERDGAARAPRQNVQRIGGWRVREDADDGLFRLGPEHGGMGATFGFARHPLHPAMAAFGEKFQQVRASFPWPSSVGDGDGVKAQAVRTLLHLARARVSRRRHADPR